MLLRVLAVSVTRSYDVRPGLPRWFKTLNLNSPSIRFGLCTAVTPEFGPDPSERERRSIIAKREPNDVLLFRFRV
jgi:hypothetical protein